MTEMATVVADVFLIGTPSQRWRRGVAKLFKAGGIGEEERRDAADGIRGGQVGWTGRGRHRGGLTQWQS